MSEKQHDTWSVLLFYFCLFWHPCVWHALVMTWMLHNPAALALSYSLGVYYHSESGRKERTTSSRITARSYMQLTNEIRVWESGDLTLSTESQVLCPRSPPSHDLIRLLAALQYSHPETCNTHQKNSSVRSLPTFFCYLFTKLSRPKDHRDFMFLSVWLYNIAYSYVMPSKEPNINYGLSSHLGRQRQWELQNWVAKQLKDRWFSL